MQPARQRLFAERSASVTPVQRKYVIIPEQFRLITSEYGKDCPVSRQPAHTFGGLYHTHFQDAEYK